MPLQPSNPKQRHKFTYQAIGTHWSIETQAPLKPIVRRAILERVELFDKTYSRFRDDSLVTQLTRARGTFHFPPDAIELMGFYRRLYGATQGAVTPLIGRALTEAGYDAQYSFVSRTIKPVPAWDEAMSWQGDQVTTVCPVTLDVGAAGKGYLIDLVGDILESYEMNNYVIDASGDIRHRGKEVEQVGLENPHDSQYVIGVMSLHNESLCASAANRRRWGKGLHHIVDPAARRPVESVAATWVKARSTMVADGIATALFFVDGAQLEQYWDFEYVRLNASGSVSHSHEYMGELFL